jgi:hypothetical protein
VRLVVAGRIERQLPDQLSVFGEDADPQTVVVFDVFDAYTDPDAQPQSRGPNWVVESESHVESMMEISLQWLDGRTLLTLMQRGGPLWRRRTRVHGRAGASSWTGSWPGSRRGPRPERAEMRAMA